ncbi:ABC transporter permease subunit [Nocardioides sp.]|uniref:ABC transporter permease subunit n=1 Tax=Nocardioides sp. TaxID=35761 RepID=UPI0027215C97|nr:ABC transporter permease subunit [Nocardioides sp.]MDO9457576.1 ABC transporter permease subunit [Nocardioides sp.]
MSAATVERKPETAADPGGAPAPDEAVPRRRVPLWWWLAGVLGAWVVLSIVLGDRWTLYLPGQGTRGIHETLGDFRRDLIAGRDDNPVMQAVGALSDLFNTVVEWLQGLVSQAAFPRPVPQIGWLGVIGIAGWVSLAVAGWKHALGVVAGLGAIGLLGYWPEAMDTLIITFFSVAICLLVGLPIAVLMGTNRRVNAIVTPVLDVMQTMPSFVYLAPMALFFSLGPAIAVAVTVVYAMPPAIRISAHALRAVSPTTIEATTSMGQTAGQRLRKVQLPMARRTIIIGVNQTMMAALSMVVIAGFVNSPGLGIPVLRALRAGDNQVGVAFVAGLSIVVVAIVLDRVTTAASERSELAARGAAPGRGRWILLGVVGIAAVVMVYLSRTYFSLATFPESEVGPRVADAVQSAADWANDHLRGVTTFVQETTTTLFINPLQDLVAGSPWFVTGAALVLLAQLLGGWRATLSTVVCVGGILATGLWYDAMVTLTSVLVATVFVMVVALVLGVWMARRRGVDRVLRPVLDAAQVMPSFVYLIPVLGLFGPGRFTAIFAAVVYAVPVAAKLVADGVRQVSPTTVEAATAAGSTAFQLITKVQLPMARGHLVLAANQGLLYVLSIVVIGGLVGGGALGYDVALGFSRSEFFGKGLAAGIAIVLLGVMVDRVAKQAAERRR